VPILVLVKYDSSYIHGVISAVTVSGMKIKSCLVEGKESCMTVMFMLAKPITITGCIHEKSGLYQVISLCLWIEFARKKKGANGNKKWDKEKCKYHIMICDLAVTNDDESDGVIAENLTDKTDVKVMWNTAMYYQRLYWQCQAR